MAGKCFRSPFILLKYCQAYFTVNVVLQLGDRFEF